jgi:hypothetical protein
MPAGDFQYAAFFVLSLMPAGEFHHAFFCVSGTNEYILSAARQQYIDFGIME